MRTRPHKIRMLLSVCWLSHGYLNSHKLISSVEDRRLLEGIEATAKTDMMTAENVKQDRIRFPRLVKFELPPCDHRPHTLEHLLAIAPNLTTLTLHSHLGAANRKSIQQFTRLREVILTRNMWTIPPALDQLVDDTLRTCKQLTSLGWINSVQSSSNEQWQSFFREMPLLTSLSFITVDGGHSVLASLAQSPAACSQLRSLSLDGTVCEGNFLRHFRSFTSLETLQILRPPVFSSSFDETWQFFSDPTIMPNLTSLVLQFILKPIFTWNLEKDRDSNYRKIKLSAKVEKSPPASRLVGIELNPGPTEMTFDLIPLDCLALACQYLTRPRDICAIHSTSHHWRRILIAADRYSHAYATTGYAMTIQWQDKLISDNHNDNFNRYQVQRQEMDLNILTGLQLSFVHIRSLSLKLSMLHGGDEKTYTKRMQKQFDKLRRNVYELLASLKSIEHISIIDYSEALVDGDDNDIDCVYVLSHTLLAQSLRHIDTLVTFHYEIDQQSHWMYRQSRPEQFTNDPVRIILKMHDSLIEALIRSKKLRAIGGGVLVQTMTEEQWIRLFSQLAHIECLALIDLKTLKLLDWLVNRPVVPPDLHRLSAIDRIRSLHRIVGLEVNDNYMNYYLSEWLPLLHSIGCTQLRTIRDLHLCKIGTATSILGKISDLTHFTQLRELTISFREYGENRESYQLSNPLPHLYQLHLQYIQPSYSSSAKRIHQFVTHFLTCVPSLHCLKLTKCNMSIEYLQEVLTTATPRLLELDVTDALFACDGTCDSSEAAIKALSHTFRTPLSLHLLRIKDVLFSFSSTGRTLPLNLTLLSKASTRCEKMLQYATNLDWISLLILPREELIRKRDALQKLGGARTSSVQWDAEWHKKWLSQLDEWTALETHLQTTAASSTATRTTIATPAPRLVGIELNPGPTALSATMNAQSLFPDGVHSIFAYLSATDWMNSARSCRYWYTCANESEPTRDITIAATRSFDLTIQDLLGAPFLRRHLIAIVSSHSSQDRISQAVRWKQPEYHQLSPLEMLQSVAHFTSLRTLEIELLSPCDDTTEVHQAVASLKQATSSSSIGTKLISLTLCCKLSALLTDISSLISHLPSLTPSLTSIHLHYACLNSVVPSLVDMQHLSECRNLKSLTLEEYHRDSSATLHNKDVQSIYDAIRELTNRWRTLENDRSISIILSERMLTALFLLINPPPTTTTTTTIFPHIRHINTQPLSTGQLQSLLLLMPNLTSLRCAFLLDDSHLLSSFSQLESLQLEQRGMDPSTSTFLKLNSLPRLTHLSMRASLSKYRDIWKDIFTAAPQLSSLHFDSRVPMFDQLLPYAARITKLQLTSTWLPVSALATITTHFTHLQEFFIHPYTFGVARIGGTRDNNLNFDLLKEHFSNIHVLPQLDRLFIEYMSDSDPDDEYQMCDTFFFYWSRIEKINTNSYRLPLVSS